MSIAKYMVDRAVDENKDIKVEGEYMDAIAAMLTPMLKPCPCCNHVAVLEAIEDDNRYDFNIWCDGNQCYINAGRVPAINKGQSWSIFNKAILISLINRWNRRP